MLRNRSVRGVLAGALLAMGAAACGAPVDDSVESQQSSALTDNALTANALTANALTANALTANALTANALTANALTANALTANALRDPLSRELMKYVVSCALDDGDSITVKVDGTKYQFDGSLGLAPDWGRSHGSCDGSCQRWVSACVLARVDAAGVKREISIRGDNRALWPEWGEVRGYPIREAAYYGNLFATGQPRFLCLSPGQKGDERVCGPSLTDCPMTVVGSCKDACDDTGFLRDFEGCSDAGRVGRGHEYQEVVTVFLPAR